MKAMRAGRPPSEEQLSAIGQALETARHDPAARKRIEAEVNGSDSKRTRTISTRRHPTADAAAWSDDYHNGFEMSDLDWAYQEAMARGRSEPATHAEPGGEVTPPAGKSEPASKGRQGEPASAGRAERLAGRGRHARPPGRLHLAAPGQRSTRSGKAGAPRIKPRTPAGWRDWPRCFAPKSSTRAPRSPCQASTDRPPDGPPTRARRRPPRPITTDTGSLRPIPATQPPAVPEARRPLLRGYFLRPAEPDARGQAPLTSRRVRPTLTARDIRATRPGPRGCSSAWRSARPWPRSWSGPRPRRQVLALAGRCGSVSSVHAAPAHAVGARPLDRVRGARSC